MGEPGSSALILRRTFSELALPNAIMDRAHDWLGKRVHWDGDNKTFRWPNRATLTFGFLKTENDKYRYQGPDFNTICFDEVTQFSESQYNYLHSRLRRAEGSQIPIRMRSAGNPDGVGLEWVKRHFVKPGDKSRPFIPGKFRENPYLDQDAYEKELDKLDAVTRARLKYGDWEIQAAGNKFKREWFEIVRDYPHDARKVRFWDLAATEPKPGKDPDWTAGAFMAELSGIYYLKIQRLRASPKGVEDYTRQTAAMDGKEVEIVIEQEPGSSGVHVIDHYQREVLKGYSVYGERSTGSKEVRANPFSAACEAGNIKLIEGDWVSEFLDEAVLFPEGAHDDQVDSASGAFNRLFEPGITVFGVTSGDKTEEDEEEIVYAEDWS